MVEIKAKDVWNKICDSSWNKEACNFYSNRNIGKNKLLNQGKANFDELIGEVGEKPWFRAAYYAGKEGYMDMHIRQNRTIFMKEKIAKYLKDRRTLFVDFGCGPMTSGVVLAEMLSTPMADYRDKVIYVGVDVAENMCKISNWINEIEENCCIFDRFYMLNEDTLAPKEVCNKVGEHFEPEVVVLCLSYVLAKDTYSKDQPAAVELAKEWQKIIQKLPDCQETLVIYMNPKFFGVHTNWDCMVQEFKSNLLKNWHFKVSPMKSIPVDGLPKKVDTQTIIGNKRMG